MTGIVFKSIDLTLFAGVDPAVKTAVDVSLKGLNTMSRHQLTISVKPDPAAAGTVTVKGLSAGSQLPPAKFDGRLVAIDMTKGSQIFIFYGMFDALRFEFASFGAGTKISAHIISHEDELLIGGTTP